MLYVPMLNFNVLQVLYFVYGMHIGRWLHTLPLNGYYEIALPLARVDILTVETSIFCDSLIFFK